MQNMFQLSVLIRICVLIYYINIKHLQIFVWVFTILHTIIYQAHLTSKHALVHILLSTL